MEIYFIVTFIVLASSSSTTKNYRSDYVYSRKTDAFYKLHTESLWNQKASHVCRSEGATLMVPSSPLDIAQAHSMMKQFPDIGDLLWVGDDELKHEPAEEQAIVDLDLIKPRDADTWLNTNVRTCEVITRRGDVETSGCYKRRPFICKVPAKDAMYDSRCQVYGKDYNYFESVGSCYKIPNIVFSWNQAYDDCRAQGSHLLVINSDLERQVVKNMTKETPPLLSATIPSFYFVGVRAEKKKDGSPRVFKTIFGQTLAEAGFDEWSSNEPNNHFNEEDCVTIFKLNGKYNDFSCFRENAFICEKEVNLTQNKG